MSFEKRSRAFVVMRPDIMQVRGRVHKCPHKRDSYLAVFEFEFPNCD